MDNEVFEDRERRGCPRHRESPTPRQRDDRRRQTNNGLLLLSKDRPKGPPQLDRTADWATI
jgi:hypothetical protein